ncbi:MAG: LUD domain-containing protein [Anaerolineales bacterium]|nr:LUD domain-containing protein [Anaerolineales bacterium]
MSTPFRTQIRAALADPKLQAALDANAERRQNAYRQAYITLPEELQVMRQRAHAVRARVIANLDRYLDEFTANAQANGLIVHRAVDAAEALEIVRRIARESGARSVAKSKTMVSEEIRLNQALEADGVRATETDLGEYIVQLRQEPPAHIITPAVHLNRAQVGQTFHEKLGLPPTEDIPTLTAAARRVLRQTFLEADIGVSGVNFGVVESGALCLLTNEGNGRMVTTLPQVHIALMGIERLAPSFDDLALMLYLLPRSATGQKLTVYVSLIHGPRRPDEIDGARQRHLVLIDNGRRALRDSPLAEILYCIRCGACLNACPVFREIGGHAYVSVDGHGTPYPGPMGSVVSPGLFGVSQFGHLARASSLCGACKEACPVDIDLPELLLRVRAAGAQPGPAAPGKPAAHVPWGLSLGLRLFTWVAVSPWRFSAAQRLGGVFSRLFAPFSPWLRLPALTGWGYGRDFPRPSTRPFLSRFSARSAPSSHSLAPLPPAAAPPPPASAAPQSLAQLRARFEAELTDLGGTVTFCREDQLLHGVLEALRSQGTESVQAWDGAQLPPCLLDGLRAAGVRVQQAPDPDIQAGLTGALAGIAETGSLVIPSGAGRPLTASLLPELHIAILRAGDLRASLAQALSLPQVREASCTVLVSGPSRTADIEMTLTIGVHGPRQVHVFCVDPAHE